MSSGSRPKRAVILAGGRGTRMQRPDAAARLTPAQEAAADEGSKGMMPIHGRPFLDYVLSWLADAGIEAVCLVTPPGGGADPRPLRAAGATGACRSRSASRPRRSGSRDALLSAEAFAGAEEFLALNSDNVYPVAAYRALRELDGPGLVVFERERLLAKSNFPEERVASSPSSAVDATGFWSGSSRSRRRRTLAAACGGRRFC